MPVRCAPRRPVHRERLVALLRPAQQRHRDLRRQRRRLQRRRRAGGRRPTTAIWTPIAPDGRSMSRATVSHPARALGARFQVTDLPAVGGRLGVIRLRQPRPAPRTRDALPAVRCVQPTRRPAVRHRWRRLPGDRARQRRRRARSSRADENARSTAPAGSPVTAPRARRSPWSGDGGLPKSPTRAATITFSRTGMGRLLSTNPPARHHARAHRRRWTSRWTLRPASPRPRSASRNRRARSNGQPPRRPGHRSVAGTGGSETIDRRRNGDHAARSRSALRHAGADPGGADRAGALGTHALADDDAHGDARRGGDIFALDQNDTRRRRPRLDARGTASADAHQRPLGARACHARRQGQSPGARTPTR